MDSVIKVKYIKEVVSTLAKEFKFSNVNQIPKIEKICINIWIGSVLQGSKDYEKIMDNVMLITGQKPVLRRAKIAVSNFSLRKGMPVGLSVTLRGDKMYSFLGRLLNVALPRIRDFGGISNKSFDGNANYSLGIRDITIFPEVDIDTISKTIGMQINIITSTSEKEESFKLLQGVGFPFKGK